MNNTWATPNNAGEPLNKQFAVHFFQKEVKDLWVYMPKNLKQYTTQKTGVDGTHVTFNLMKPVTAHKRTDSRTDIPLTSIHGMRVTVEMEQYAIRELVDRMDKTEIMQNEMSLLAKAFTRAMNERQDQIIIDAIDAGIPDDGTLGDGRREDNKGYNIPVSAYWKSTDSDGAETTDIKPVHGSDDRNTRGLIAALLHARTYLNDNHVPWDGRVAVMSPYVEEKLMRSEEFRNHDYNNQWNMQSGKLNDTYLGFRFMVIGQSELDGLPVSDATANRKARPDILIFHKQCVAYASAIELQTWYGFDAAKASDQIVMAFKSGAKTKEGLGTVRIQVNDTTGV